MKLGLRSLTGMWFLGWSFGAIQSNGEEFHHPGLFHGHLWDAAYRDGAFVAIFLLLVAPLIRITWSLFIDRWAYSPLHDMSQAVQLTYGFFLAGFVVLPFHLFGIGDTPQIHAVYLAVIVASGIAWWIFSPTDSLHLESRSKNTPTPGRVSVVVDPPIALAAAPLALPSDQV